MGFQAIVRTVHSRMALSPTTFTCRADSLYTHYIGVLGKYSPVMLRYVGKGCSTVVGGCPYNTKELRRQNDVTSYKRINFGKAKAFSKTASLSNFRSPTCPPHLPYVSSLLPYIASALLIAHDQSA